MADLSNFWFLHLAAFNYCFAGDPHPIHFCPIWCGANAASKRRAGPRSPPRAPFAEWTDLGPKGTMCYVPAAFIAVNGRMRVWPPQFPEPLSSWMATVMRRRAWLGEPLRRALMTLGEQLEADATTQAEIDAIPRVLFERAEAVGDRAHDSYEAGRAPIQWNDVADAATIARLQIPAGFGFGVGDAFPSSESVARSVVAALAARSAG
jgi:hypothetical protein